MNEDRTENLDKIFDEYFDEDGINKNLKKKFSWILEEAEKRYDEGMHWRDFSNMFFGQNSKYMPQDRQERDVYLKSDVFNRIMSMKFDLESIQEDVHTDPEEEYKGNFMVRGPKSLHEDLVKISAEEGISLNQLAVYFLSQSVARYNNR